MMTDAELAAIRERVNAATPGPWVAYVEGREHTCGSSFLMRGIAPNRHEDLELIGGSDADYDFIAHARQDIPALLEEVERLRARTKSPQSNQGPESPDQDPEDPKTQDPEPMK